MVHLLLIVGLQVQVIFGDMGLFPGFVVLFLQHLHNGIQDVVGGVTLSQPVGGKDPPKKNPKALNTKLHPDPT